MTTYAGSRFDAVQFDSKMNEQFASEKEDAFTSYDEVSESFDVMGLLENLLRGIYAYGFKKPSAIQQMGIVPFIKGLDVIEKLSLAHERLQLFALIEKFMRALGDYQSILAAGVHVVVGTLGRVFDLLKRRSLRADYIKMPVLDEAVITC
nr:eukaryotic initiation factor 4A-8-like [Tanacetum cinerariifolium]